MRYTGRMLTPTVYNVLFGVVIGIIVFTGVFFYLFSMKIRKDVERALEDATTEEQTIIRNKVVKAMFPPRFTRD